jgi:hypothetical protein
MTDLRYPIGESPRVESLTPAERRQAIGALAACPAELRRAIAGLDDARLDTPYRDGGWTVRQVVHHLPDSHMNAYVRHKLSITEERPTIKPYDEALWAELEDGRTGDPQVSLALLAALTDRWVRFLDSLDPADFARTHVHPQMNATLTLDCSLAIYGWHSRHHVAQIDALRTSMGWK